MQKSFREIRSTIKVLLIFSLVYSLSITGCLSTRHVNSSAWHSSYDDSTLLVQGGPLLMPYNRFIDPTGTEVRFGNPTLENHSLDCVLLPGAKVLAVENRYGVAFINIETKTLLFDLEYDDDKRTEGLMSTYSGIKTFSKNGITHLFWSAAGKDTSRSVVLDAVWDGKKAVVSRFFDFAPLPPSPMALPNDLAIRTENGDDFLYVVLNGNSQLCKIRLSDEKVIWSVNTGMAPYGITIAANKIYVSNWAGPVPTDSSLETAGIPYAEVYINHRTGGTAMGTVSVIVPTSGKTLGEIPVGLHPTAIISSPDQQRIYVANGNSDNISVINTATDKIEDSISVRLHVVGNPYTGSSPNALAFDKAGTRLYVSNGMDNAIAVVNTGLINQGGNTHDKTIVGYIPTEAYPAGLVLDSDNLYVCNLEGEGSRILVKDKYTAHRQGATVSIIPIPDQKDLPGLTKRVENANMLFRTKLSQLLPRKNVAPRPVPERIGEPSLIKHVIYIIKENRTYDQVLGDMKEGDGRSSLCIYGEPVTPNQHQLTRDFQLLDNYYASGKSSAEGHQWTDAAMTSDYVEKNVRAWFRSYPHVQNDALVYNKEGFLWNNALDHGKSVRIYGEACNPHWDKKLHWKDIYTRHQQGLPVKFTNETTISRVRPILSPNCPCADTHDFPDVMRADAFIEEMKTAEKSNDDQWPELMIMALSDDHTTGLREGYPTPRAMVADNDLAVGKIVEAVSHSRFWKSTAIFITEDDSQDGWDHVSAYRTTGFVVSPFSELHKTVHTNYNQTCMVRTIEQILGIPPMNVIDATALPMFDCFKSVPDTNTYTAIINNIPLDEMNKEESSLAGKELEYAHISAQPQFDRVDGPDDDLLNHILWFTAKGNKPYPKRSVKPDQDDD